MKPVYRGTLLAILWAGSATLIFYMSGWNFTRGDVGAVWATTACFVAAFGFIVGRFPG